MCDRRFDDDAGGRLCGNQAVGRAIVASIALLFLIGFPLGRRLRILQIRRAVQWEVRAGRLPKFQDGAGAKDRSADADRGPGLCRGLRFPVRLGVPMRECLRGN